MRRSAGFALLIAFLALPASAASRRWHVVWGVSQGLLAGADAADAATSWGKYETNPLVRTGHSFGYGSLAIKLGALGGGLAAQHLIHRKSPDRAPLFATGNLASAALLGAAAVHNVHVPK